MVVADCVHSVQDPRETQETLEADTSARPEVSLISHSPRDTLEPCLITTIVRSVFHLTQLENNGFCKRNVT